MFARVALITTGWVAETTATYFLTVLEARNMRSRGQQGWFLLRSVSMTCGWPSSCSHKLPRCMSMILIPITTYVYSTRVSNYWTPTRCPTIYLNLTLPGDSVRSHKLRAQAYKTAHPSPPLTLKLQVQVATCNSDSLAIDCSFQ